MKFTKRFFLSLLLLFALLLGLSAGAFAVSPWTEVSSARELSEALADDGAQPLSVDDVAEASAPARVLLFADALPDACGAARVLHWGDWREFVLEFASEDAARAAAETLQTTYGLTDCWVASGLPEAEPLDADESAACASWGAAAMGLDTLKTEADTYLGDARTVTVAIIDTGADLSISQLQGRRISAASYDYANHTETVTETASDGHGTTIASLIADLTPDNVELMILHASKPADVLSALQGALDAGADVINMSIGWYASKYTTEKWNAIQGVVQVGLEAAAAQGIAVICAAGNYKADVEGTFPACYETTIAVSALDQSMDFADTWTATTGSGYGPGIDFSAPGTKITTGAAGGGTKTSSGTSLAAPHITAAAAYVLLAEPGATASQVYQTLRGYAQDLGVAGKDNLYGWGCPYMAAYFHDVLCPLLRFSDMPDAASWAHAGLDYCLLRGILNGVSATEIAPDGVTTRAQLVTMLWRLAGSPSAAGESGFTDLTQSWYRAAVAWAAEKGIVYGISDTLFAPDDAVTREQAATLLYRYAEKLLGEDVSAEGSDAVALADSAALDAFPDVAAVSDYARDALAWAVSTGLINGVRDGDTVWLDPQSSATRAQIAALLMRFGTR